MYAYLKKVIVEKLTIIKLRKNLVNYYKRICIYFLHLLKEDTIYLCRNHETQKLFWGAIS